MRFSTVPVFDGESAEAELNPFLARDLAMHPAVEA